MISSNILHFLKELAGNNNKEWFRKNQDRYIHARHEFELVTGILINEIGRFDKNVSGLLPKDCIFRIFRDVRFSNDKTPYKTNFGTYISKGGRKGGYAGYYLHIEPGSCFLAGGIYMPLPPVLKAIRNEIYHNMDEFMEILAAKKFRQYFGEIQGARLTAPPRGFDKDLPGIELLKYKDYNVVHELSEQQLTGKDFISYAVMVFREMLPFNRFLNQAVEGVIQGLQ
jgi:uncharacterized protein (TIGR02453 family)